MIVDPENPPTLAYAYTLVVNLKPPPSKPPLLSIAYHDGVITKSQACRAYLKQRRAKRLVFAKGVKPIGFYLIDINATDSATLNELLRKQIETPKNYNNAIDPVKTTSLLNLRFGTTIDAFLFILICIVFFTSDHSISATSTAIGITTYLSGLIHRADLPVSVKFLNTRNLKALLVAIASMCFFYTVANLAAAFSILEGSLEVTEASRHILRSLASIVIVFAAYAITSFIGTLGNANEWHLQSRIDNMLASVNEAALSTHGIERKTVQTRLLAFAANQLAIDPFIFIRHRLPSSFIPQTRITVWYMIPEYSKSNNAKQCETPRKPLYFKPECVASYGLDAEIEVELRAACKTVQVRPHNKELFEQAEEKMTEAKNRLARREVFRKFCEQQNENGNPVTSLTGYVFHKRQQKDVRLLDHCQVYQRDILDMLKHSGHHGLAKHLESSAISGHPVFGSKCDEFGAIPKGVLLVFHEGYPRAFTGDALNVCELTARCLGIIQTDSQTNQKVI